MRLSEQWLRTWSDPKLTTAELINTLTMAGLEVEGFDPVAGQFDGVVVGHVLEVTKHPEADRLRVCKVSISMDTSKVLTIVCGADNVRKGLKVAVATIGARLPNNIKIKKSKLRNVESEGMICSENELGLSQEAKGIMELSEDAPLGVNLREYLLLDDVAIEVAITPNRGDCLSVRGIARELSALTQTPFEDKNILALKATISEIVPIKLQAPQACPRYVGRVIRNIDAAAQTPVWMVERLRRSGLRPLNPVVDVTNYVMLELGHPLHAFDLDCLSKEIIVRFAKPDEQLLLLNGQTVTLNDKTLIIADAEKPLAIAGVMGGQESAITTSSKHLFLEGAFFIPQCISGRARYYNLQTDAATRYERGVDPTLQRAAIEYATELLLKIVGGEPGPINELTDSSYLPQRLPIKLAKHRISRYLGIDIEEKTSVEILQRLHFDVTDLANELSVVSPPFRFDIKQEVDLIEEIARVHGYQNIPSFIPKGTGAAQLPSEGEVAVQVLRERLVMLGYHEVITYSFVDAKLQELLDPEFTPLALVNPITTDLAVMRTSLWPGLITTLQYNRNRQQKRLRLFEVGLRFRKEGDLLRQEPVISGLCMGSRFPEQWGYPEQCVDFFDVKGDAQALLSLTGQLQNVSFAEFNYPSLHPGQAATILLKDKAIGVIGALHPRINSIIECEENIYLFEILLESITNAVIPIYKASSKFPSIRRDIAIVVEESVQASTIYQVIRKTAKQFLRELTLFDVYQGSGITPGCKSLALGLLWQHEDRTLTDEEVNESMNQIVTILQSQFNAILRK